MSYKGRVVDFNEKRKPLGNVQKKFVKVLVESNMDFDSAFAKFKVEELREFLQHKSDYGRAVKDCMLKIFTEQEMKTCSVRCKKSKQGKQRECLPGVKLSAIIDTVKEKFGQSADIFYKMNQVLRNFPGRKN